MLSPERLGVAARVLFLDAGTQTLVQRFSETRRRHPLSGRSELSDAPGQRALVEAIDFERELLAPIKAGALGFDTSQTTPAQLRAWIRQAVQAASGGMSLVFESFGFKRGVPLDADFVFDARMLPNPYYDLSMRAMTGLDPAVTQYLDKYPQAAELVQDIAAFLERWLPRFEAEQRSYLTVAVGCTGGQHRSVFVVEQLARRFAPGRDVLVRHRDLQAAQAALAAPHPSK
jgi:UPF0042 nucleotide-binding protein